MHFRSFQTRFFAILPKEILLLALLIRGLICVVCAELHKLSEWHNYACVRTWAQLKQLNISSAHVNRQP